MIAQPVTRVKEDGAGGGGTRVAFIISIFSLPSDSPAFDKESSLRLSSGFHFLEVSLLLFSQRIIVTHNRLMLVIEMCDSRHELIIRLQKRRDGVMDATSSSSLVHSLT